MPALLEADPEFRARRNFIAPKNAPRIRDAVGSHVTHIFGMTEGVIMFTRRDDPQEVLDLSVGRPVCSQDEIRIVEPETETPVPDGSEGEALFRGPYTISGYYKSEQNNAEKFTADGFYRSGDLMSSRVIDGKRYYFFRGRLKDVVDRGGEKINAEELENVINRNPLVLASAVVGMPDATYGERVCAYIVPKQQGVSIGVQELLQFPEAEGLAKFKWPERVEIIPEFPLTASGKLSKAILRQIIIQKLQSEQAASAN
jgi:non-ribosomal peptide synthetase component E (peptide arylation enzyme)